MSDGMTEMNREEAYAKLEDALSKQVGGNHYANMKIQPAEFIALNNLGFLEGNVIKYVCRHEAKNGEQDIDKAIHYLQLIKSIKYK